MDFESARRQFQRLSRLFKQGAISQEEFIEGVDRLSVTDRDGVEWQIGMQTGNWYRRKGGEWIEDDPAERQAAPSGTGRGRRALLALAVLLLLLLALFGANYFSKGGDPETDSLGKGSGPGEQSTLPVAQATETQPPLQAGETGEDGQDGGDQTATATQQAPGLTPTETLLPPPPRVPPQVWQVEAEISFSASDALTNEWGAVPEEDWEYEFLEYQGAESLFLQYTQPAALWHAGGQDFSDTDRSLTLALTNTAGRLWMACRYDSEMQSGYALKLSRAEWALVVFSEGEETALAQGPQSQVFQLGGFETFRLRCANDEIAAWDSRGILAAAADEGPGSGSLGLLFGLEQGVGVAVIDEDRVAARQPEGQPAGVGDTVWLDTVEVELRQVLQSSGEQNLLGVILRVAKWEGGGVEIGAQNIYLLSGQERLYPLETAPQGAAQTLGLPLALNDGEHSGGLYFAGVSPGELGAWQLVVDLRYEGFGEARFNLGE